MAHVSPERLSDSSMVFLGPDNEFEVTISFEKDRALHIVERVREWNCRAVRSEGRHAIENELREICGWLPVDDSVHREAG